MNCVMCGNLPIPNSPKPPAATVGTKLVAAIVLANIRAAPPATMGKMTEKAHLNTLLSTKFPTHSIFCPLRISRER